MIEWEKFSAFGDIGELEHVCYLLDQASEEKQTDLHDLIGESSHLISKLTEQDRYSAQVLEGERPGLYPRTWIAHLFSGLYVLLNEIAEKPQLLSAELGRLAIDLHKVMIAAHDIFDPHHRAALIAEGERQAAEKISKARADGEAAGKEQAKSEQSTKARNAVKSRGDQVLKQAFMKWAEPAVSNGANAATVNDLQGLSGFKSEWSKVSEATLKAWAKEAGFQLKRGRPRKSK